VESLIHKKKYDDTLMQAYAGLCRPMQAYAGLCRPMQAYAGQKYSISISKIKSLYVNKM